MITPLDIQNKEFKKSLRGYDIEEVDRFLDSVNDNYEELYRENIEKTDKIHLLTEQIRQYDNLEETLKSTLVIAQSTADDVTSNARQKADLIVEEAEIKSNNLVNDAIEEVRKINLEYDALKKEMYIFKMKYKSFLESQIIYLDDFEERENIVDLSKIDNLEEIPDVNKIAEVE